MRDLQGLWKTVAIWCASIGMSACSSSATAPAAAGASHPAPQDTTPSGIAVCGPGQRPDVAGGCSAVGPSGERDGFSPAEDGWGHRAIKPADSCTGAAMAKLGSGECVPVDDCNRPFPPAGAILLHDGDDIIAAAKNAGTSDVTVALDRGSYHGFGVGGGNHLHVIGRCAKDVVLSGTDQELGIGADNGAVVDVESVTVKGFGMGARYTGGTGSLKRVVFVGNGAAVEAQQGGGVTVDEVVVDGSGVAGTDPVRALLTMTKGTISATSVDIRNVTRALTSFDEGSVLDVTRSVVNVAATSADDFTMLAMVNGSIRVHQSYVGATRQTLLQTGQIPSFDGAGPAEIIVEQSVLEQSGAYLAGPMLYAAGGTLSISQSTVRSQAEVATLVFGDATRATLEDSAIVVGSASAAKGAELDGLAVVHGAAATLTRSAVVGAQGSAISTFDAGTTLKLDGSLVTGTTLASTADVTAAFALAVQMESVATVLGSALTGNEGIAAALGSAAKAEIDDSVIDDTRQAAGSLGEAVVNTADGELSMQHSIVRGSAAAGIMLLRAKGSLHDVRITDTPVGINTWETTIINDRDSPGDRELVMIDVRFDRTDTQISEGEMSVDLPKPPASP